MLVHALAVLVASYYNHNMKRIVYYQQGQVLLITLLILSLAITVGLSLVGRETINTNISNQVAESARAFSAAEAGIEESLKSGQDTQGSEVVFAPGLSYKVSKNQIGGAEGTYIFPKKTNKGLDEVLWLTDHDANGYLVENAAADYAGSYIDVCWTDAIPKPAVIVSLLYKRGSSYDVARGAYDPVAGSRSPANNFSAVTDDTAGCGGSSNTNFRQRIDLPTFISGFDPASDTLLMARFRPVYSDTQFAVNTPTGITSKLQGYSYESSGTTEIGLTRNIIVYQQYRAASSLFDFAVYSQQGSFRSQ